MFCVVVWECTNAYLVVFVCVPIAMSCWPLSFQLPDPDIAKEEDEWHDVTREVRFPRFRIVIFFLFPLRYFLTFTSKNSTFCFCFCFTLSCSLRSCCSHRFCLGVLCVTCGFLSVLFFFVWSVVYVYAVVFFFLFFVVFLCIAYLIMLNLIFFN